MRKPYSVEHFPTKLSSVKLDDYLANGYFRMGNKMFTTTFICFEHQIYNTIWLRIKLSNSNFLGKKLSNIRKKYVLEIEPFQLSEEVEELYTKYINERPFSGANSIKSLLYDHSEPSDVFNTMQITIRDQGHLIGLGIFDQGEKSSAGIISFFDPSYQKESIGKLIIQSKLTYCQDIGQDYFYPGYFVPGYPSFDYKLKLSENGIEYFAADLSIWIPIEKFNENKIEINLIIRKLLTIGNKIPTENGEVNIMAYPNFFQSSRSNALVTFFDNPFFILLEKVFKKTGNRVLVYNSRAKQYEVLKVDILGPHYPANEYLTVSKMDYSFKNPMEIEEYLKEFYSIRSNE